jgi:hypothetical protein
MADSTQIGFTAASADGVNPSNMRGGRLNDLIVSLHNPRFAEMAIRGRSYSLGLAATTTGVTIGNITGAAAAGSTQFALWNPTTSGVNVVLKRFLFGIISGSLAPGPLLHNVFSAALPTIASVGTALNNLVGGPTGQAKFVASAAGTTLTGGSLLSLLRPSTISFGPSTTVYAAAAGSAHFEDIDGDIVLPPGTGWVPCFSAAGTALLNAWGISWNEIPI